MVLIFLLGVMLRLRCFLSSSVFWMDEAYLGINFLEANSLTELFHPLKFCQVCPPLFLVLSKFFVFMFGVHEHSFRMLPLVFSILSLILFPFFCNEFIKNRILIITAYLFLSLNYGVIEYSAQFKQYSCEMFFAMLCTIILIKFKDGKIQTITQKSVSLFIIFISAWFSYFSYIIIFGGILALLIYKKSLKEYKMLLFVFSLNLLLLLFHSLPIFRVSYEFMSNYWKPDFLTVNKAASIFLLPVMIIKSFVSRVESIKEVYYLRTFIHEYIFMFMLLVSLFCYKGKNYLFLIFPVLIYTGLSYFSLCPIALRLMLFLVPFFIIGIVYCLENIPDEKIKNFIGIIFLIFAFLCLKPNLNIKNIQNAAEHITYIKKFLSYIKEKDCHETIYTLSDFDGMICHVYIDFFDIKPKAYKFFYEYRNKIFQSPKDVDEDFYLIINAPIYAYDLEMQYAMMRISEEILEKYKDRISFQYYTEAESKSFGGMNLYHIKKKE